MRGLRGEEWVMAGAQTHSPAPWVRCGSSKHGPWLSGDTPSVTGLGSWRSLVTSRWPCVLAPTSRSGLESTTLLPVLGGGVLVSGVLPCYLSPPGPGMSHGCALRALGTLARAQSGQRGPGVAPQRHLLATPTQAHRDARPSGCPSAWSNLGLEGRPRGLGRGHRQRQTRSFWRSHCPLGKGHYNDGAGGLLRVPGQNGARVSGICWAWLQLVVHMETRCQPGRVPPWPPGPEIPMEVA